METTFAVSCQSSDSVPSRLKDEGKMIQARVTGKVETRSKRRSRACWKDVAEPERWCLDGGAVYVGKTWRSRKGGAWLLRWRSRAGWKDVAEPERWCLDGGAVSVGNRRWSRKAVGWMWKAKPKSTKENTRTTKGSEDGRHKRLRKQNICCQKENKSLETIVFFSGNKRFAEQTLAEAEPQKLGLDGGAVRVGKTWRSRKGGAWMAEPCLLGTEGGAGTQLDEVWKAKPKSTKENTRTTKGSEDGRHKHLRKQNTSCQKENKSLETIVFSGNKRFAETFETARKNKHSTPVVERFIFPEETKVCLKGLFPVTKQTSHNILSNKGFQQNKQTKLPKKGLFWRVSN